MPISGDQQLDPNQRRFGMPLDSCVGDDGPSPEEVAMISKPGTRATAAAMAAPTGGSIAAGGSRGKARAQRASEDWIPGATSGDPGVPIGYDGP